MSVATGLRSLLAQGAGVIRDNPLASAGAAGAAGLAAGGVPAMMYRGQRDDATQYANDQERLKLFEAFGRTAFTKYPNDPKKRNEFIAVQLQNYMNGGPGPEWSNPWSKGWESSYGDRNGPAPELAALLGLKR